MQGVHDIFDVDLFRHLIAASVELTDQPATGAHAAKPSRHCRSSALDLFPDRGRRAALERGARLCAPPHHAPRDAARASSGRAAIRFSPGLLPCWSGNGRAIPNYNAPRGAMTSETLRLEELRFPR